MSEAKKPLPVNRSRIASRVRGREAATELLSLLDDEVRSDPEAMEVLVELLESFTNRNQPKAPEPTEPTEPIARLGCTRIPFGQHNGKDFDGVPLDYLDWLCREQESFYKTLRSYLKHPDLESRRRGL
jgi:hypothetical protein